MSDKTDRELLEEIHSTVTEMGVDYYGDEKRSIKGTKPQVEDNTADIAQWKTIAHTLMFLVGSGSVVAVIAFIRSL